MCHILIVEDNQAFASYLALLFTKAGHECTTCLTAEEAEAVIQCVLPDLAVIDICLPGKNGVALAWDLHQKKPELPILVHSANLDAWEEEDLLDCGVSIALPKPCPAADLLQAINGLLSPDPARPAHACAG